MYDLQNSWKTEIRISFESVKATISYFTNNACFQFQPPKQDFQNGGGILPEEDSCVIAEIASDIKEEEANVSFGIRNIYLIHELLKFQDSNPARSRQDSTDFKIRLRKELVSRDGHK